jgi:cytochrome b6-f complex iron-sulfur subunit
MVVSDESKGGAPKKLSTKDILAAARAQAAQAAGAGAPAACAPTEPAKATPPAPVDADKPAADQPAAKPPEKSTGKPTGKPAAGKKPTSTADILAAARAQAAGGAAPPAEEVPAAPKAAPAAKPAAPMPATGGKPKSTADILAAARAAAAGGAPAAAPAAGAGEKPVAKEKPSKPTVAKAAPATTREGPKLSVQEMLAAVRPGGVAPAAEAPAIAAKPAKASVAPPMPAKPAPVKSAAGTPVSVPAPDAGRRNLLLAALLTPFALIGGLFSSAFAAAWTMLAATTGIATLATARFMLPNVLTEPPSKFKIGSPSDFDLGTVATRFVATNGVWIVHTEGYKGKNLIYALISVCTHLGCTPSWLEGERKFKCPCHGSGFYITGINFEGPAPRPLERAGIRLAEDGMLEVDKSVKFQEEMGQWNDPTSFFEVVS